MADPGKDPRKDGFLVTAYKKYMTKLCRRRFGNAVSPEKIDQLLDDILDEKLREPKIYAVSNMLWRRIPSGTSSSCCDLSATTRRRPERSTTASNSSRIGLGGTANRITPRSSRTPCTAFSAMRSSSSTTSSWKPPGRQRLHRL